MNFKILVVEDERDISSIIVKYLAEEGYFASVAENGFEALEFFAKDSFHLVLLDIMLPGIDGFEILKEIRNISDVPVIMLTAKEQEIDKVKGFDFGADDYVVKPFSPRELMRRIKAVIKRVYNFKDEKILESGELKLYIDSKKLLKNGEDLNITSTEFQIMETFFKNKNCVLTREQIIRTSFGYEYDGFDRNIDSYIKRLRHKIEVDSKDPKYLVTKYGIGYVFKEGGI